MKISNHTIIVDNYPKFGEHLLYSTRTQALVKINHELKRFLDTLDKNNKFPSNQLENINNLYAMGLLVKNEEEDIEKLEDFLNQLKYGYNKSKFVTTILTTSACNLKCVYCFEESSRENGKLNLKTQDQIIDWLKRRVQKLEYQGILLNYYGGEPLLNLPAIEYISTEMKEWCASQGIHFGMTMQTNGYLMTPHIIKRLKELNLERVRISVDGTKEHHDGNRPLRGGGPTFDKIINNIKECVDHTEICISTGFEGENIEHIKNLINYFKELGILHKLGQFICSPIHATLGPKGNPTKIQRPECMRHHKDKTLAKAIGQINQLMIQNNLPYKSGMSTNACGLIRENSGVTIDPNGLIFRCNSLIGHPEFSIGDVRQDVFNEKQKEFRDLDVWRQCPADCTYLPMCSGGCRLMSFVGKKGNFTTLSCKKKYLDEMTPDLIKQDYERMTVKA